MLDAKRVLGTVKEVEEVRGAIKAVQTVVTITIIFGVIVTLLLVGYSQYY